MVPDLRRRISNCGRGSAHPVDDAAAQSGRRAFLARGAVVAGAVASGAARAHAYTPKEPPRSWPLGPGVVARRCCSRAPEIPSTATTRSGRVGSSLAKTFSMCSLAERRAALRAVRFVADRPQKVVGSFRPCAAALWDSTDRTSPFPAPHSLSTNDVYAATDYVLNLSDLVDNNFIADRNSLPKVKTPSRGRFLWRDPRPDIAAHEYMTRIHDKLRGSETTQDRTDGGRKERGTAVPRAA